MNKSELANEALNRARGSLSVANFPAIFQGFADKGIAEDDIEPRVNVLTFQAWKALGRTVKKGEHGVRVVTWLAHEKKNDDGEVTGTYRRPKAATVFHVSQTKTLES